MMARTLRGDGQAVELTRQADGKVANVDHLLHFAQAFLGDLARLPGHQFAQIRLVLTQQVAKLTHQFAAARRRNLAPGFECMFGAGHVLLDLGSPFPMHGTDPAAINGRMYRLPALLVQRGVNTKTIQ